MLRKSVGVPGEEFAVVFDFGWGTEFFPVFLDGADAVGADGDDLFDFVLREAFEVGLGELPEEQIVAEATDGIAGAFFFAENPVACAEVVHDAGEVGYDFSAFGIVAAHTAEPEAIFLAAVEDGECLLLDEFVALTGAHAKCV